MLFKTAFAMYLFLRWEEEDETRKNFNFSLPICKQFLVYWNRAANTARAIPDLMSVV